MNAKLFYWQHDTSQAVLCERHGEVALRAGWQVGHEADADSACAWCALEQKHPLLRVNVTEEAKP
jgi:hypothetical protein